MVIEKRTKIASEIFYFLIKCVPANLEKKHFFDIIEKDVENLIITRSMDEFEEHLWTHFVVIRTVSRVIKIIAICYCKLNKII